MASVVVYVIFGLAIIGALALLKGMEYLINKYDK